jgi:DNA-binding response OmpR family regulator
MLAGILEADGAEVSIASDGDIAIDLLSQNTYSAILLDIVLPRVSGTTVMEFLSATNPSALERVIVVSGLEVSEIHALFPTVRRALPKPVIPSRLRASVRECLAVRAFASL